VPSEPSGCAGLLPMKIHAATGISQNSVSRSAGGRLILETREELITESGDSEGFGCNT
jgi:hypothetical protein